MNIYIFHSHIHQWSLCNQFVMIYYFQIIWRTNDLSISMISITFYPLCAHTLDLILIQILLWYHINITQWLEIDPSNTCYQYIHWQFPIFQCVKNCYYLTDSTISLYKHLQYISSTIWLPSILLNKHHLLVWKHIHLGIYRFASL